MSSFTKDEQTTIPVRYVQCDKCGKSVKAEGVLSAIGWMTAICLNEAQTRQYEIAKLLDGTGGSVLDQCTRNLCPDCAPLFEKFVNSDG